MAVNAHDITGSPFSVGDAVNLRGRVTSITPVNPLGDGSVQDSILVTIDVAGNTGEVQGATVLVGPHQCRRAQGKTASDTVPY